MRIGSHFFSFFFFFSGKKEERRGMQRDGRGEIYKCNAHTVKPNAGRYGESIKGKEEERGGQAMTI